MLNFQMVPNLPFGKGKFGLLSGAFSRLVSFREGLLFKVACPAGLYAMKGHGTAEIEAVMPPLVVINVYMG